MENLSPFRWICGFCIFLLFATVTEAKSIHVNLLRCKTEHGIVLSLQGQASANNPVLLSYLSLRRNFYLNLIDYDAENETIRMQLASIQSMILYGVAETYSISLQGPIEWENLPATLQLQGYITKSAFSLLNPNFPAWTSPTVQIDCQIGLVSDQEND